MDQSPRKRVTRARVAARAAAAAESNSKSNSKVNMTTSKAGPTTTNIMSTSSSLPSSKRKIQNDEVHIKDGDRKNTELEDKTVLPKFKTTRSRTRAGLIPESQIKAKPEPESVAVDNLATKKPARGRPRKALQTETLPPRTLRGRGTRVANVEEKQKTSSFEEKVPKRRGQQDTTTITTTAITKPSGPKRCVKFEGLGKENINPSAKNPKKDIVINEETHGTGFRAKPLRKPVSTTRATRGRSKPIQQEGLIKSSVCLATKKLEHNDDTSSKPLAMEHSDDELAMKINKSIPHSSLKACPLRPTTNAFNATEDSDVHSSTSTKILEPKNTKAHDEMKGVITSPARRPPQTPLKQDAGVNTRSLGIASSVLRSSKPTKMFIPTIKSEIPSDSNATSLLQSPARRLPLYQDRFVSGDEEKLNSLPVITDECESKNDNSESLHGAITPKSVLKTKHRKIRSEIKSLDIQPELVSQLEISNDSNRKLDEQIFPQPTSIFSGRMSCIVPRDIDPTFAAESVTQETKSIMESPPQEFTRTTQILENVKNPTNDEVDNNTPSFLPYGNKYNSFMLRRDIGPISEDSDSEDELSSVPAFGRDAFVAPSPYPRSGGITPKSNFTGQLKQNEGIGFTPLAQKFSHWMTTSPGKKPHAKVEFSETLTTIWDSEPKWVEEREEYQDDMTPSLQIISDEEVKLSTHKMEQLTPTPMEIDSVQDEKQIEQEETEIDDEDLELALEANEMSLLEPSQINIPDNIMFFSEQSPLETTDHHIMTGPQIEDRYVLEREKDSIPEINENNSYDVNKNVKSQDLSDMAIDPRLLALSPQTVNTSFMTPKRTYTQRVYHTVCKVPLKPAAGETPERPMVTRSASASRMASSCSNTHRHQTGKVSNSSREKLIQESALMTPNKQTLDWSSLGTPARTPRPDLDKSLLKGAVVYVDVYTTEGADASVIFIELLTQMGARCIKSWSWNGNIEESKIGITHVIYKDGGKRTLEKVRESDGVVLCVGVAWVLDCERENKWLDETPYLVDTDVFPRGGGRRRKSMEPRALANMNGTLIPCPNTARASQRRCFSGGDSNRSMNEGEETPMTSKSHRRDSVQWLRSILPEEGETSSIEDKKKNEKSKVISFLPPLTPSGVVNEKIIYDQNFCDNKYPSCFDGSKALSEEYGGTPINHEEEEEDEEPYFLHKENLQQKTAPVKRRFYDAELQQDIGDSNSTTYSSNNDNNSSFGGVYRNNSSSSSTAPTANTNSTGTAPESYDYGFMMRLKAARRKSLQWAPKIGSPLARAF